MAERRSLGDAIGITPQQAAFIKGQPAKADKSSAEQQPKETTIDLSPKTEADRADERSRVTPRRQKRARSNQELPNASDILDQVLVPVTIRLPHRIAQALKRAYLEQKLKHAKPDTAQEIGQEALADWLENAGYLD